MLMALICRSEAGRRAAPYFESSVTLLLEEWAGDDSANLDIWRTRDNTFEIRVEYDLNSFSPNSVAWSVSALEPFSGGFREAGNPLGEGLSPLATPEGGRGAMERALLAALAWLNKDVPPEILAAAQRRDKLAQAKW
jgi:hypothetical protein